VASRGTAPGVSALRLDRGSAVRRAKGGEAPVTPLGMARGRFGWGSRHVEGCARAGRKRVPREPGARRGLHLREEKRPYGGDHRGSFGRCPTGAADARSGRRIFAGFSLELSADGFPVARRLLISLIEPRSESGAPANGTCADAIWSVVALAMMALRSR